MVRGGALALAAILMLGAVSGVEAQEESASVAGWLTSLTGALPSLPQNWSDLPLQLKATEALGYNDNVLNTPSNQPLFHSVRSFESISDYGASKKWNWEGEQFFADAEYGFYRYLSDAALDTDHYSVDAGVNWIYTSTCFGKLALTAQKSPSQPNQQVAINVLNTVTTLTFSETANCAVTGNWGFVFNSGTSKSTNSAAADALNNFQNKFVAAGMTYTVAEANTLQLLATVTGTSYPDRGSAATQTGLLNKFTEDQVNLSYTRVINPNLSLIGSIGVVGITNGDFDFGWPSGWEPQYSISTTWSVTPRITLSASFAHVVTPPTSLIGNLQVNENALLDLKYQLTPKVMLGVGGTWGLSSGFGAVSATGLLLPIRQGSLQRNYNFRASVAYSMSPFLTANLSYQYYRQESNLVTPSNVALLTVNYAPY